MFLPSHLHTGSDQKVPAPTGSGSATLLPTYYQYLAVGGNGEASVPLVVLLQDQVPRHHLHLHPLLQVFI